MSDYNHNILNKKLKKGSGNYKVLSYLLSNSESISVADARNLGLTNDLRSRLSDLRNRYGVEGLQSREVAGETGAKYMVHWLAKGQEHSVPPSNEVEIRVKNSVGEWFLAKYDKKRCIVYYRDGRSQKDVGAEKIKAHIKSGMIEIIKGEI